MTTRPSPVKKTSTRNAGAKQAAASSGVTKAPRRRSVAPPEQGADVPVLPVDQLERLHAIKPDAVDWVIQQTQLEAEHRREETSRVNGFVLLERLLGQVIALTIGAAGIVGGSWVAVHGQPWAGAAIAIFAMSGLTLAYLAGRKPGA